MKEFMDKDFLLETETAKHLFHDYAEHLPLVDYHCHIPPKDVYEDVRFDNLAESGSAVKIRTEATSVTTTNGV